MFDYLFGVMMIKKLEKDGTFERREEKDMRGDGNRRKSNGRRRDNESIKE